MSRITVAALSANKEETLDSLRNWGLLHILPLQTPENEQVTAAKAAFAQAQRVLEALPAKATTETVDENDLLAKISEVLQSKKEAEEALTASSAELKYLEPFGDFDPHIIRELLKRDVHIKLYHAEEKAYKGAKDFIVKEFKRTKGEVFFAVFSKDHINLPYTEIALPLKSVQELKKDKEQAEKTIAECEKKLAAYASKRKNVGKLVLQASDELAFKAASAGMHSEIGVCFIQGYCPKEKLASLSELAAKNGWGIISQEPTADESVPTLLKHHKFVKPMDTLYDALSISPGYREVDISSVFLLFFSIFFAMIVGDAVYGLLFLGITFFASKKLTEAPRHIFHFLYIMSACTVFWGILNAGYLGLNKDSSIVAAIDICKASWAPEFLRNTADWIRVDENVQYICFVLALIHLTIAHIWNAWVNRSEKPRVITKAGWLCITWMMFFLVCNLVLRHEFPQQVLYLGIAGVVLIVLGLALRADWFSLGMLPLNLISSLVDVISYIRLFAVGMAGYSLANAFNGLAGDLSEINIIGTLGAALILLLVHALNIALAVMGVAVHGVRLNTLEFSGNMGVEWGGYAYSPFKKSI
jgi:V/A-type H+-transporting ATPase subunit I